MTKNYKSNTTNVTATVTYKSAGDEPDTITIDLGVGRHILYPIKPQDATTAQ